MTTRIEKTVFISYRRTNGIWARAIYQDLTAHGYDAFYDFQSINSGDFSQLILENIKARAHFLILLTPSALDRCEDPEDWLRREIESAIDSKRNIVPLMLESFDFGSPESKKSLTGKLALLKNYNGLKVYSDYFEEGMTRLRERYLNIALDAVLHPVSHAVEKATKEQQRQASNAEPVKKKELSALEWFEKGLKSKDLEEKVRYYTEAIRINPGFAGAYNNRGNVRKFTGDFSGAVEDFSKAIASEPDNLTIRIGYFGALQKLGRKPEADNQSRIISNTIPTAPEYDQACFEALCGNLDKALILLKIALEKNQPNGGKDWAMGDPDLENLRNDPRFKELFGK